VIDYFEKLSLFSAGIDRLSSFIKRLSVRGWGWHTGGIESVRVRGGMDGCVESSQHQSYVLSLCHVVGRVVRNLLSRVGVTVKIFDFSGAKVRLCTLIALTCTPFMLLKVTVMTRTALLRIDALFLFVPIVDIGP
jgi:hypothetical protein